MSQSIGHIDFYPNGGELMPGCSTNKGHPDDLDAIWMGKIDLLQLQSFIFFTVVVTDSFSSVFCLLYLSVIVISNKAKPKCILSKQ